MPADVLNKRMDQPTDKGHGEKGGLLAQAGVFAALHTLLLELTGRTEPLEHWGTSRHPQKGSIWASNEQGSG